MRKGQFALEFVILVSFTLLFSAIFLVVIQKSYAAAQAEKNEEQANEVMRIISSEVYLAELSPSGYERRFYIPSLIDGADYNVSSSDDTDVVLHYNSKEYVFFLPNSTLMGACSCLKPGYNTIRKDCPPNSKCVIYLYNENAKTRCQYYVNYGTYSACNG